MLFKKEAVSTLLLVGSSAAFAPKSLPAFVSLSTKSCIPATTSAPVPSGEGRTVLVQHHARGCTCTACALSTSTQTSSSTSTALFACRCPDCVGGGNSLNRRQNSNHNSGCAGTACTGSTTSLQNHHQAACPCPACQSGGRSKHSIGCSCTQCSLRQTTRLYSEATAEDTADSDPTEEVPSEVAALDGIESSEEAHNAERPARRALKKKSPGRDGSGGKPIEEFNVGDTVKGTVKAITGYGAFLDIGSTTDGLLHISQLSVDYVADVNSVLEAGQEIDVRIINIDKDKGQVALSLLSEQEEESAKEAAKSSRQGRDRPQRGGRRDDSGILAQLVDEGWSSDQFVEGTVVSTVDFGAFVRVDASQLQEDIEGEFDGLVHISALTAGRASSVDSVVKVGEKVQVRVKAIADRKVSLTMVTPEEEVAKMDAMNSANSISNSVGAKDWKESLEKLQGSMPEFKNKPMVVDLRK